MDVTKLNREPNQIVFGKQNYTGLEKDIIVLFSTFLPKEEEAKNWNVEKELEICFKVSELREYRKSRIEAALEGIVDKKIRVVNNNKEEYLFSSIFPECSLKDGIIKVTIRGKYVLPFSTLSKGYSVYAIKEYLSLQGAFPKRLFEMFSSYVNRKQNVLLLEVQTLKEYLGIPNKYKGRNSDLLNKVIVPAINQIENNTSLIIDFDFFRKQKKTHAKFEITRKQKEESTEQDQVPESDKKTNEVIERVKTPLNEKQAKAKEYLVKYGFTPAQINNCIMSEDNLMMFFQWHYNVDRNMPYPRIQLSFFKYLKDAGLKI